MTKLKTYLAMTAFVAGAYSGYDGYGVAGPRGKARKKRPQAALQRASRKKNRGAK